MKVIILLLYMFLYCKYTKSAQDSVKMDCQGAKMTAAPICQLYYINPLIMWLQSSF